MHVLVASGSVSEGPNAATVGATFTTQLRSDNQQFSGSGELTAEATAPPTGLARALGQDYAFLTFSIDEPYTFTFFGSFANDGGYGEFSSLLNRMTDPPVFDPAFTVYLRGTEGARVGNAAGVLLPGLYQFRLYASASAACGGPNARACDLARARSDFDFDFQLSPQAEEAVVPEPATMILLGSGLVGVFAARRRQRALRIALGTSASYKRPETESNEDKSRSLGN